MVGLLNAGVVANCQTTQFLMLHGLNSIDVTDKVQTPNKVQTVGDKVQHTVSEYLQGAPCR